MRSDLVFQETRWLPLRRRRDFSGIKAIKQRILFVVSQMSKLALQMEHQSIDFNADKVKRYEAVREAMNMHGEPEDIFLTFWLRDMQPKTGFGSVPSSLKWSFVHIKKYGKLLILRDIIEVQEVVFCKLKVGDHA